MKGSKHFGYAFPAYSIEEVKEYLEEVKKKHHSARHHCYSYRLGLDKKVFRANDDGEPSNSAGKPILGQIQSFELTNVFICVVRYFGGVKLGVGGLIDAYRTAAKMAIQENTILERQVHHFYKLEFDYDAMPKVMSLIKELQLEMNEPDFQLSCSLLTDIRMDNASLLENAINGIHGAKFKLINIA